MKDTNAIENALKQKIHDELVTLVSKFTSDLRALKSSYGAESGFYTLNKDSGHSDWKQEISSIRHSELDNILIRMLKAGHGEQMLKIKTKELLNKLELI
mgnify:FL=1